MVEPCEAGRAAQFPPERALASGPVERPSEALEDDGRVVHRSPLDVPICAEHAGEALLHDVVHTAEPAAVGVDRDVADLVDPVDPAPGHDRKHHGEHINKSVRIPREVAPRLRLLPRSAVICALAPRISARRRALEGTLDIDDSELSSLRCGCVARLATSLAPDPAPEPLDPRGAPRRRYPPGDEGDADEGAPRARTDPAC